MIMVSGDLMPCCTAVGCSKRTERGVKLHRFPVNRERQQIWKKQSQSFGVGTNFEFVLMSARMATLELMEWSPASSQQQEQQCEDTSQTAAMAATQAGRLAGKVAIVTASTDGIGLAIARRLGEEGAKVTVSSRGEANVQRAVDELQGLGCAVMGVKCHVSKKQERQTLVDKTVEKFGGLDILVSNAAANPGVGGVLDCPEDAWDKIFEVNVKNAWELSQLAVPHMKRREGGSIIYVSTIAAYQQLEMLGAYAVSKTALLGLNRAVATQVAPDNIRVNCVVPGLFKTKFADVIMKNPQAMETIIARTPLRRLGEPKEMAGLVAFLCSDDASYITGESFVAAGGMFSRI